jgi:hypothetical protein
MRKLHTLLVLLAGLFAAAIACPQEAPRDTRTQEAAAAQGLAILRSLTAEKSRDLGFTSDAEAARATLAPPLAVFNVELAALKEFRAGGDASALIKSSPAAFYPVLLDGAVRSGVRVENMGRGWEPARVGNSGLATAVDRARSALPTPEGRETALVQVLALNLLFVAQKTAGGWQLAPVIDDASVELKVGKVEPASSVFTRLAPLAARHNGDPT